MTKSVAVHLDGGFGQVKTLGDPLVRPAGGDGGEDFAFALGEVVESALLLGAQ